MSTPAPRPPTPTTPARPAPPAPPAATDLSTIVLATGNPHKVDELRAIFARADVRVLGLADLPAPPGHTAFPEPAETGTTFAENARIKAIAYARLTGRVCLADDSGLEVDALDGRPGVISSHFATDGVETGLTRAQRDASNNDHLLALLQGVPLERRGARFVCCMCLAAPANGAHAFVLAETRATFDGFIGLPPDVPRGVHGFGYDPLFLVAQTSPDSPPHTPHISLPVRPGARTSAELSPDEKHARSHRGAAARAMALQLGTLRDAR
jgi:XTP/dITP diphosphohydrolase